jgi:hypothetical protein
MTMPAAGKAVGGFIEAMRGMPLVLALCVMNGGLIGFAYYQASAFNSQRKDNVALMVDIQRDAQKLLSQCIVPVRPPQ